MLFVSDQHICKMLELSAMAFVIAMLRLMQKCCNNRDSTLSFGAKIACQAALQLLMHVEMELKSMCSRSFAYETSYF